MVRLRLSLFACILAAVAFSAPAHADSGLLGGVTCECDEEGLLVTLRYSPGDFDLVVFIGPKGGRLARFSRIPMDPCGSSSFILTGRKGFRPGRYELVGLVYDGGRLVEERRFEFELTVPVFLEFGRVERTGWGAMKFVLRQSGLRGRMIYWDFCDSHGKVVHSKRIRSSSHFGRAFCVWNGRDSGGVRLPDGEYELIYRADGIPPKSERLDLVFGVGADPENAGK